MTPLHHDGARCGLALIVWTVPAIPTVPGVGAFDHPAVPQGRQTCAAFGTGRDCEAPRGTLGGHPGWESGIVVRVVPKDRREARKGCDGNQRE